jgi:hypothetical protein
LRLLRRSQVDHRQEEDPIDLNAPLLLATAGRGTMFMRRSAEHPGTDPAASQKGSCRIGSSASKHDRRPRCQAHGPSSREHHRIQPGATVESCCFQAKKCVGERPLALQNAAILWLLRSCSANNSRHFAQISGRRMRMTPQWGRRATHPRGGWWSAHCRTNGIGGGARTCPVGRPGVCVALTVPLTVNMATAAGLRIELRVRKAA